MKTASTIRPNQRRRKPNEAGFSLIELMVVIAIIAMLAAVVGYNVLGALDEAEVTTAAAEIRTFKNAVISYRLTFKRFPSNDEGLDALINNEKNKSFLDASEIPTDPWGNPYVYKLEGSRDYEIISYGADGTPGGDAENADISSKHLTKEK